MLIKFGDLIENLNELAVRTYRETFWHKQNNLAKKKNL